jgi:hypothetical protein
MYTSGAAGKSRVTAEMWFRHFGCQWSCSATAAIFFALTRNLQVSVRALSLDRANVNVFELQSKVRRQYPGAAASNVLVQAAAIASASSPPFVFVFDEHARKDFAAASSTSSGNRLQ